MHIDKEGSTSNRPYARMITPNRSNDMSHFNWTYVAGNVRVDRYEQFVIEDHVLLFKCLT